MLKYKLHPEAVADINESIDYYDEERIGLGMEFYGEFQRTLGLSLVLGYADVRALGYRVCPLLRSYSSRDLASDDIAGPMCDT